MIVPLTHEPTKLVAQIEAAITQGCDTLVGIRQGSGTGIKWLAAYRRSSDKFTLDALYRLYMPYLNLSVGDAVHTTNLRDPEWTKHFLNVLSERIDANGY